MMFNSISKKLKGDTPPPKSQKEMEGFICPICMASFVSPELVQKHFDEKHPEDTSKEKTDTETLFSPTTQRKESIRDIQENLNDLRQSLDEEVWYNEELKKECTRLNIVVAEKDKDILSRDKTIEDYLKQIDQTEAARDTLNDELKKMRTLKTSLAEENKTIRNDFWICEERVIELELSRNELINTNDQQKSECASLKDEILKLRAMETVDDGKVLQLTEQLSKANLELESNRKKLLNNCEDTDKMKTYHNNREQELNVKCANLTQYIQELKLENLSLNQSNEKFLSDYQQKLQLSTNECCDLKKKIESIKIKLNESEDNLNNIKRNWDSDISQLEKVKGQLKDLENEFHITKSQNKELMQKNKSQEIEILQIQNVCSNIEEDKKILDKAVKNSSEQLECMRQQLDMERMAKDKLQSQVEMTDAANIILEQMQAEKKNLQENLANLQNHLKEDTDRTNKELSENRLVIQSLKEKIHNLTSLVCEKEEKVKESEKINYDINTVCEKYQQKVSEEISTRSNLEDKIMVLTRNIQNKEESLNASVESQISLKIEHEKSLKACEKERDTAMASLENLSKEIEIVNLKASKVELLEKEIQLAREKISQLDKDVEITKKENDQLSRANVSLKTNENKLEIQFAANVKLIQDFETLISEKDKEIESQINIINTNTSQISDFQAKLAHSIVEIKGLQDELQIVMESQVNLQSQLDEKNKEIYNCKQSMEKSEIGLTESSKIISALESEIMIIKKNLLEQQDTFSVLSKEKMILENTCMEKENIAETLKKSLDLLCTEKDEISAKLSMTKIQVEEAQSLYSESMKQQNIKENQLKDVSEELKTSNTKLFELQEKHKKHQLEYQTEIDQLRKEGNNLKNHTKALEKTLNESSENYNQERLEYEEKELTLKSQCEDLEMKIVQLTKSLQRTEEDLEGEKCLRQTERNNMMEKISQLTNQVINAEKLRNDLDQRLEVIETDNIENKLRLEAAMDEKERLLEKIIQMENNFKKQNEGFTKKCREFDQLQSAILDLGRENQSLQITKEKITSRLWVVDDEAVECHNCHKLFSLTHRKHHCRNCGQVFCQDCSGKTATLAVSRKPVRVCDVCHLEVQSHRRNSSTQSSNISLSLQN